MQYTVDRRQPLDEIVKAIVACGTDVHFHIVGEMGIGKSSMETSIIEGLEQKTGEQWYFIYFDCASMSDGADVFIPFPNRDEGYFERILSKRLAAYPEDANLVIMLDEFTKANRMVVQVLHTLLEKRKRLGDKDYKQDKVISFSTGNLSDEGVGDVLQAHTRNRVCEVEALKPTPEQWLAWAAENDIDPPVMAWVNQNPEALASFRDPEFDDQNPYVLNPKKVQGAVVTPRSLEKASFITKQRDKFSYNMLQAALAGVIGEPAMLSLANFIKYQDQLPSREAILKSPDTAPVPDSSVVQVTLAFNLLAMVERETMTPIMKYVRRLNKENQGPFCINLSRSKTKSQFAFNNAAFNQWVIENHDIV